MSKEKSKEDQDIEHGEMIGCNKMKYLIYKFEELKEKGFKIEIDTSSTEQYFHFTISKKIYVINTSRDFECPFEFDHTKVLKSIDHYVNEVEKLSKTTE